MARISDQPLRYWNGFDEAGFYSYIVAFLTKNPRVRACILKSITDGIIKSISNIPSQNLEHRIAGEATTRSAPGPKLSDEEWVLLAETIQSLLESGVLERLLTRVHQRQFKPRD